MAKRKKYRKQSKALKELDSLKFLKTVIIPCAIVIIASCVYLIWWNTQKISTASNIEYIRSFMTSSGTLRDYQNKLGMHDPAEDIKWYKTSDEIRIEFGRIVLTWTPEDFVKAENLKHIEDIGFTVKVIEEDGQKVMHLYWKGKEVQRWVR